MMAAIKTWITSGISNYQKHLVPGQTYTGYASVKTATSDKEYLDFKSTGIIMYGYPSTGTPQEYSDSNRRASCEVIAVLQCRYCGNLSTIEATAYEVLDDMCRIIYRGDLTGTYQPQIISIELPIIIEGQNIAEMAVVAKFETFMEL